MLKKKLTNLPTKDGVATSYFLELLLELIKFICCNEITNVELCQALLFQFQFIIWFVCKDADAIQYNNEIGKCAHKKKYLQTRRYQKKPLSCQVRYLLRISYKRA